MPSTNNAGKGVNSSTSVQYSLKGDVTTYFARVNIGADGSGSLDQSGGQSKGVLFFAGPDELGSVGQYTFLYDPQEQWLGSPNVTWVSGGLNANPQNGEMYVGRVVAYEPNADISAFSIPKITRAAVVSVFMYHLSGSTEATIANPPSGSQLYLTVAGTQSPVF